MIKIYIFKQLLPYFNTLMRILLASYAHSQKTNYFELNLYKKKYYQYSYFKK